ncbi:xanthine dehydrogenase family protein molybdopterin-binding subunit [Pseudolabrys taiwanensis]|uniref:Xanthine dehydrogenase family protein molybdopterin-binding subunit n=1 Tax=Pseudolabrys taiwanensis TaxID=331696 RepID=A0A346A122_9HYPH|nr:xanthine dehydrogenase family protein molybdopterin-binding subunit [Pseudolabrys taiwanensis]AXK82869.1 xanthine dehydrogenase family protein molybdopterin-binding subunit [Pseudolabrys taiwanensis]
MSDNGTFKGRREDRRLVTGQGRYTNDWNLEGQLYAAFRRSDRGHAIIKSIDTSAAASAPGVVAVVTGRDVADAGFATLPPISPPPGRGGQGILVPQRPVLAGDRVRFVGEEIAVVVAKTAAAARDAADMIDIDFDDLPVLIGFENAMAADATVIHDNIPGNICFDFEYGDEQKTADAFARAAGVVTLTAESPRVAPTPMEVRGALVSYDAAADSFDVYCASQGGPAFGQDLALMAGVPADRVRVHMVDVGGAFGARTAPFPEYPAMLYLAKKLKKPIKWLSTRSEDFLTDNHGRAVSLKGELAYDDKGKFLALRTEWLCDSGAYLAPAGVLTNSVNGKVVGAGAYAIEAVYGRHRQVITNTSPTNAYRGAGRPEANYIVERLVDEAAAKLGVDPLELRRRNVLRKAQFPYNTPTGVRFDSADFPGLLAAAKEKADWKGFAARRRQSRKAGKLRGIGCGLFIEPSGGGGVKKDEVAVVFQNDGTIVIHNAAGPSGQGHETVFPELVGGWLGVPVERIVSHSGDPKGPRLTGAPSIGSRSGMTLGSAFKIAAEVVVEKAKKLAADALEAPPEDIEFKDGVFTIAGTDRTMKMTEVIERHASDSPHPLDTVAERPPSMAFPSGAHVVELEIDADTGDIEVVRYTAVDDIGNAINHTLANGQLLGGIMQGAGHVFGEHCAYDESNGQLITGSFMDYCMPRAHLLPAIDLVEHNVPSPNNPLGAKGVGESGTTGAMPACMNAVMDALRSVGVKHFDIPATPSRIWDAIAAAKAAG